MPESSSLTQNWENVDKRETKKNPAANFSRGIFFSYELKVVSYLIMKGLYPQGKAQANNL